MKAKIKTTHRVTAKVCVALVCLLLVTSGEAKGPAKNPVKGDGATQGGVLGGFTGTGTLYIRGQAHEVQIETTIDLSTYRISDDGVAHVVSSHKFTFDNGDTIITLDKSHLTPTDDPLVRLLNGNLEIVDGTAGVTGRLTAQGTATVTDPVSEEMQTSFKLQGSISSYDHQ